jgi:uncharacterized protein
MSEAAWGSSEVRLRWGVRIPLRDGISLTGTLYTPMNQHDPLPAIVTLTPYIAQTYHDVGMYFASYGYPFLAIDVRGRGNSEGAFRPNIQEAHDGYDVVEWLANQPFCDGRVVMWGGSYAGYAQWATAKECPPHLTAVIPVASPYMGLDFPMRNNIPGPYLIRWLMLVAGHTSQERMFWDEDQYWTKKFRQWFESGLPFRELDTFFAFPSPILQEWLAHPQLDAYWDSYNPTSEQYARIGIPILTITGIYDGDQPGALMHYQEHLKNAPASIGQQHYLVIGPWDHTGTRTPKAEFAGLRVGPAGLVDLRHLQRQWYDWVLNDGERPAFLRKNVAYYVMGAERWRYAHSLEEITEHSSALFLDASLNPTDVFASGRLSVKASTRGEPDEYIYDPRDLSLAAVESMTDAEDKSDQRMMYARVSKQLVYHGAPFEEDQEVSGFFQLSAWISIDQPDTDFAVAVYEIDRGGGSVLLTSDWVRARYRESLREARVIDSKEPLHYEFQRFTFVSRLIKQGHRLRLTIGPINSIFCQKNYNSGGRVSEESMRDARAVTVRVFHDELHPSVLQVPFGRTEEGA